MTEKENISQANRYIYNIRLAVQKDTESIHKIELVSFKDPYPIGLIYQLIRDRNALCLVLEVEHQIVAYIFGIIRSSKRGHIASIAVHPNYRKSHLGSILVENFIKIVTEKGICEIVLEVRISNIIAQNLYKKFNFKLREIIHRYYSDGEDAYLMIWQSLKDS